MKLSISDNKIQMRAQEARLAVEGMERNSQVRNQANKMIQFACFHGSQQILIPTSGTERSKRFMSIYRDHTNHPS